MGFPGCVGSMDVTHIYFLVGSMAYLQGKLSEQESICLTLSVKLSIEQNMNNVLLLAKGVTCFLLVQESNFWIATRLHAMVHVGRAWLIVLLDADTVEKMVQKQWLIAS